MSRLFILISVFFISIAFTGQPPLKGGLWFTDYGSALSKARLEHKPVMMVFSGSDWCKPCMRLQKEVFEDAAFNEFAAANLVLLEIDFPRNRKNLLPREQSEANGLLAKNFNPEGIFPLVVLIGEDGQVLARTGFREGGALGYIAHLRLLLKS